MQLSSYITNVGDYALSKDPDVALWLDNREFKGFPPLVDAVDFVIVNGQLHNQFDQFKSKECTSQRSFLPMNELLKFYCSSECAHLLESSMITKYGKTYLNLQAKQVDELIEWTYMMRKRCEQESENIFATPVMMGERPFCLMHAYACTTKL